MRKTGFTLVEVTLAISVMAVGVLTIISLFGFGYRESSQSNEDVASAAYADAVISQLVMAIGQTNVSWSTFRDLQGETAEVGWGYYVNENSGRIKSGVDGKAKDEYSKWTKKLNWPNAWPAGAAGDMKAALVLQHDQGSRIVRIGFRATRTEHTLMSQPLYYTEACFQGDTDK